MASKVAEPMVGKDEIKVLCSNMRLPFLDAFYAGPQLNGLVSFPRLCLCCHRHDVKRLIIIERLYCVGSR